MLKDDHRSDAAYYRWNPFLCRFEFWYAYMWQASIYKPRDVITRMNSNVNFNWLSYRNTWCEPYQDMDNE